MFRAVNTESENERRKESFEKSKIQTMYLATLKSLNIDKFLSLKINYERNQVFFESAKSNLLYSFVSKSPSEKIVEVLEKYEILKFKTPFFEFVRKTLEDENYLRAQKLLNLAKSNKWAGNDYFNLKTQIEKDYYAKFKCKKRKGSNKACRK